MFYIAISRLRKGGMHAGKCQQKMNTCSQNILAKNLDLFLREEGGKVMKLSSYAIKRA